MKLISILRFVKNNFKSNEKMKKTNEYECHFFDETRFWLQKKR